MARVGAAQVVHPQSPVASLCTRAVVAVAGDTSLAAAVDLMRHEGVSSLLLDGGRALVTERDLARAMAYGCVPSEPVSVAGSPHPITVPGHLRVIEAAALMLNEHVRHLVVELPAGALGVISLRDVLAVLLSVVDRDLWLTSLQVRIEAPAELWLG